MNFWEKYHRSDTVIILLLSSSTTWFWFVPLCTMFPVITWFKLMVDSFLHCKLLFLHLELKSILWGSALRSCKHCIPCQPFTHQFKNLVVFWVFKWWLFISPIISSTFVSRQSITSVFFSPFIYPSMHLNQCELMDSHSTRWALNDCSHYLFLYLNYLRIAQWGESL